MKKLFAIAAVGGLAAASMAVAPAAQAKTVKACVKKSDGSVKFINKKNKKCKKGWKLKTWNSAGPQGPAGPGGPAGPNWLVKDKNGVTLGTFSGYYDVGLIPWLIVTTDEGGVFRYRMDGLLGNENAELLFTNNGCSDAVIFRGNNADLGPYLQTAGGTGRAVFKMTGAPTASAWKIAATTTATVPIAANFLFSKNPNTGVCAAITHPAGFYVPLTPATAPVVAAPGSLQIVR